MDPPRNLMHTLVLLILAGRATRHSGVRARPDLARFRGPSARAASILPRKTYR